MNTTFDSATGLLRFIPRGKKQLAELQAMVEQIDPRHVKKVGKTGFTLRLDALKTYAALTRATGHETDGSG